MTPPAPSLTAPVRRWPVLAAAALLASTLALPQAQAQVPGVVVTNAAYVYSPQELENLVGPIALYPDDLVALVLPASTQPLQMVQAERFLAQRASNAQLAVDESWDDAVKSLLNYPDIVNYMSQNLDWTVALGEAVAADAGAVLDAVQTFRRRTQSVGHLRSDDKQVVVVEKEIIKIVPANPEVIYVPQYNPATVVVSGPPVWGYYPQPYPVYHYPYASGSSFAAGLVWGAAVSTLWRGNYYRPYWGGGGHHSIQVNNTQVNQVNVNVSRPGRGSGSDSVWRPSKRPDQIGQSVGRPRPPKRLGDTPRLPAPSLRSAPAPDAPPSRPSVSAQQLRDKAAAAQQQRSARPAPVRQPPALAGVDGSGREAMRDSARGAASREAAARQVNRANAAKAAHAADSARRANAASQRAGRETPAQRPARPSQESVRNKLSERRGS